MRGEGEQEAALVGSCGGVPLATQPFYMGQWFTFRVVILVAQLCGTIALAASQGTLEIIVKGESMRYSV